MTVVNPSIVSPRVRELYESGLCLQAHAEALKAGPLRDWRGTGPRVLAGRLAAHLGAPRLSRWHHLHAWREDPDDAQARCYFATYLLDARGPWTARRFLEQCGAEVGNVPGDRSHWQTLHVRVATAFRDFDLAEEWQARAEQTAPEDPWVLVSRSWVLKAQDRYDEALEAVERCHIRAPDYRPAIQTRAELLSLAGRGEEALDLLVAACARLEAASLAWLLAAQLAEAERFEEALRSIDRCFELSPLIEKDLAQLLHAQRSEISHRLGDIPAAIRWARESGQPVLATIADRLESASDAGALHLLPVGHVHQHHMTCGPATLSALSRYWRSPVDHLSLAEEICYGGTSHYAERRWARENGWLAQEFTVTPEAASTLIERGLPFTLTTSEPGGSHLRAVIGYDPRCDLMVLRDPSYPVVTYALADRLCERYRSFGPRGMILLPAFQGSLLDGIELPDAELWDLHHDVEHALETHDRERAIERLGHLERLAPAHRLTLEARWSIALHDADPRAALSAVERLLELYPGEARLERARIRFLRELAPRTELLAEHERIMAAGSAHPLQRQDHAEDLLADARRHREAEDLLLRVVRALPDDPAGYFTLAGLCWDRGERTRALELYRIAACLGPTAEGYARSYFLGARALGDVEPALRFLESRVARAGAKSSLPARTLHFAYDRLERHEDAARVLEEALARRPDDGELLLHAAEVAAEAYSLNVERIAELVGRAEPRTPRATWAGAAARIAEAGGDLRRALELWRSVLELSPLDMGAQRAVVKLLEPTEGHEAALEHLRSACERFPHHRGLGVLRLETLRDEPFTVREPLLRELLAVHPDDAWGHRELGFALVSEGRLDEAAAAVAAAMGLEPSHGAAHALEAVVSVAKGDRDAARAAARQALRLVPDNTFAMRVLLDACDTEEERREELAFTWQQLMDGFTTGEGLLAFRTLASGVLPSEELEARFRDARERRPELWQTWSALVLQLVESSRFDEARALAREAVARIPLRARLWCDLAVACRAASDGEGETEALHRALELNPTRADAVMARSDVLEREGRLEEARALLERALAADPLNPSFHGYLAEVEWRLGARPAAIERIERAVTLEPGYAWAFSRFREWCQATGDAERPARVARSIAERRPRDAEAWSMLARELRELGRDDECLEAIERALAIDPRWVPTWDLKADLLAAGGRRDDALAACAPAAFSVPPVELRARAAEILGRSGDRAAAIGRMREVLAEVPSYAWAWMCLAGWHLEAGASAEAAQAARELLRLRPLDERSHGFLGDALRRSGDRAGAKAAFRRAIELVPTYRFAAFLLFDMELEDGDLAQAPATLEHLRTHFGGPFVEARAVQLAATRKDRAGAVAAFRCLIASPEDAEWPLQAATEAMEQAGLERRAEQLLLGALPQAETNPRAAAAWIRLHLRRRRRKAWRQLRALEPPLRTLECGMDAYLGALSEQVAAWRVRWFVGRHREWLRSTTGLWGAAARALNDVRADRLAARWCAGWRAREGLTSRLLCAVAEAFHAVGRHEEAIAAHQAALERPADACTYHHELWLACESVLVRDAGPARRMLAKPRPEDCGPDEELLLAVLAAMTPVAGAEPAQLRASCRKARSALWRTNSLNPTLRGRRARARLRSRCLRLLAEWDGGLFGRWRRR